MTDCQRIVDLITPYVDDALDGAARTDVGRHVAICNPCRARLVGERRARAARRRVAPDLSTPVPPGLRSRSVGWQLLPGGGAGTDGFYYACLDKLP